LQYIAPRCSSKFHIHLAVLVQLTRCPSGRIPSLMILGQLVHLAIDTAVLQPI
jgi:hypothetical protein